MLKKLEKDKRLGTALASQAEFSLGIRTSSALPAKYCGLEIPALTEPLWTNMRASIILILSVLVLSGISRTILSVYPEWKLWLGAESTLGQIVEVNLEQDEVSYEFRALVNGEFQTVTDRQKKGVKSFKPGETIKVKYLPSDPSASIIEGAFPAVLRGTYLDSVYRYPHIAWLLGVSVESIHKAWLWFRLRMEGQVTSGMIVWRNLEKYMDNE